MRRHGARAPGPTSESAAQPAANDDFIDAVYGSFPLMIALITITTFILLARAFRSLLLPAKAIVLNILSVAAAWGVLVLVWQEGFGSEAMFGIEATGSIPSWMPLMIFAFLFGLSMDYEVFILSRMREEYDRTGSTDAAVIQGIGRTGRLVTSAALILFLAFISMASGPETDVKMMATGLAAGILLDATVIRALIVPAVISLMGRWNWWLPSWPARVLRVRPSRLEPRGARGGVGQADSLPSPPIDESAAQIRSHIGQSKRLIRGSPNVYTWNDKQPRKGSINDTLARQPRRRRLSPPTAGWSSPGSSAMVVIIGVGSAFAGEYNADYDTPDSESKAAGELTEERFDGYSGQEIYVVWKDEAGANSPAATQKIDAFFAEAEQVENVEPHTPIRYSEDGHDRLDHAAAHRPRLGRGEGGRREADRRRRGEQRRRPRDQARRGPDHAAQEAASSEGVGFLVAAIVLLIAFGSVVAAGLPLSVALVGLGISSVGLIALLANVVDVPDWTLAVVRADRDRRRHRLLAARAHSLPRGDARRQGPPRRRRRGGHHRRAQRDDRRRHRRDRRARPAASPACRTCTGSRSRHRSPCWW